MSAIVAYAVVLTLCSGPSGNDQCNDYFVDVDESKTQALATMVHESEQFAIAWESGNASIAHYLKRYEIEENPKFIVDYDYTVQVLTDDNAP